MLACNFYNYNYFYTYCLLLGGGHHEDKRNEGAGQGSKTVRTGWQSRLK